MFFPTGQIGGSQAVDSGQKIQQKPVLTLQCVQDGLERIVTGGGDVTGEGLVLQRLIHGITSTLFYAEILTWVKKLVMLKLYQMIQNEVKTWS